MSTNDAREVRSREKKGRAYPNPPPKPGIPERLERVRTHFGYKSKRAFWRALTEGGDYDISYEAVRNYHYDREPPPSYLARVAEVFGVRLEWLISEQGEMTRAEDAVAQATLALPGPQRLPWDVHARNALLAAWAALLEAHGGAWGQIVEGSERFTGGGKLTLGRYAWELLQEAVAQPLETLRSEGFLGPPQKEALNDYAASMGLALRRYTRAVQMKGEADDAEA